MYAVYTISAGPSGHEPFRGFRFHFKPSSLPLPHLPGTTIFHFRQLLDALGELRKITSKQNPSQITKNMTRGLQTDSQIEPFWMPFEQEWKTEIVHSRTLLSTTGNSL